MNDTADVTPSSNYNELTTDCNGRNNQHGCLSTMGVSKPPAGYPVRQVSSAWPTFGWTQGQMLRRAHGAGLVAVKDSNIARVDEEAENNVAKKGAPLRTGGLHQRAS